jgi:hypothetical protein
LRDACYGNRALKFDAAFGGYFFVLTGDASRISSPPLPSSILSAAANMSLGRFTGFDASCYLAAL